MKTVVMAAAFAALAISPALAQQADEHAAASYDAGMCAFSQEMLQTQADSEQQRMAETKAKLDALIDQALASPRSQAVAETHEKPSKQSPDS